MIVDTAGDINDNLNCNKNQALDLNEPLQYSKFMANT